MSADDSIRIVPLVKRSGISIISTDLLLVEALELAGELDHSIYDCIYVASMNLLSARFITWDKKLHAKLAGSRFAGQVYLLSEVDRLITHLGA